MRTGPKRTPGELRVIDGEKNKDRINLREPKPPMITPDPPAWLTGAQKRAWRKIVPTLAGMRVLTTADIVALETLCVSYAKWREAAEQAQVGVVTTPKGTVVANPMIGVEIKYLANLRQLVGEFGMTPASRAGIQAVDGDRVADPLEDILAGPRLVKK